MSNVVSVKNEPPKLRMIRDMEAGETAYTVEWAYNGEYLHTDYNITPDKQGTSKLKITCIEPGRYAIEYEPQERSWLSRLFGG